ncbi:MAG: tRNA (adenosine(37)-N6)-threonylcarbamoyltransferase complex ATPase subunit type 1 TsaE [Phycisphaerae bacterium]|nr:tRNA (adenosine(37)-N6)-threonylcarbamoyltransferase complex ATPase subunit type 1 TsaE [Phycisphaerae bacterium]
MKTFISQSVDETIVIGREIGEKLHGGEIFAITGDLGAGKTHLIKGIAAGAGAQEQHHINSPTFVLVNEYIGRLDIFHIDAYRIETSAQFEQIGFDDFLYPQSVVLIEWADKVRDILSQIDFCVWISIEHIGQTQRRIKITPNIQH